MTNHQSNRYNLKMVLKRRIIILIVLTIISFISWAQIPSSYQTEFSYAGYNGTIPSPSNIVTPSNLDKTGTTDMTSILQTAINNVNTQGGGVVFLPEGTYLFTSSISLKSNVVLRGAGSDKTKLCFDLTGTADPILMKGSMATSSNAAQLLSSDAIRGNKTISLKNNPLSNTTAGKMALLYQKPGLKAYPGDSWAQTNNSQQMLHIAQVNGKQITFEEELRSDFLVLDSAYIRIVTSPIQDAGLENFSLTCVNKQYSSETSPSNDNIVVDYADNCWIVGIEGAYSNGAHVDIRRSSNVQISGCYFHHAHGWGGGGSGYGICITGGAGQILVANCIFDSLRHAMLIQGFSNGNVFAYNYSARPNRTDYTPYDAPGDIILHGNYAHSNLFQYNIGNTLSIDNPHGANGPRNIFLRNQITRYGIYILDQRSDANGQQQLAAGIKNDSTILIGNDIVRAKEYVSSSYSYGDYRIFSGSSGNIEIGNRQMGTLVSGNQPDASSYISFFNSDKPLFWNIADHWFSIGNNLDATIPAKVRFEQGGVMTDTLKSIFSTCTSYPKLVLMSDTIIEKGSPVILHAVQSEGTIVWNTPGNTVYPIRDTFYIATASFSNGCSTTDTVRIGTICTIFPSLSIMNDTTIEIGNPVELYVKQSNGTVIWNSPSTTVYPVRDTFYIATASFSNSCSISDTIKVYVTPIETCSSYPKLVPMNDTTVRMLSPVKLYVKESEGTVTWNTSQTTIYPLKDTFFIATASFINGCNTTDTVRIYVSNTTHAINDKNDDINIHPNPFKDNLYIESKEPIEQLYFYNIKGNLLLTLKPENFSVNTSTLPLGMCFLRVQLLNGPTYVYRLIKQ